MSNKFNNFEKKTSYKFEKITYAENHSVTVLHFIEKVSLFSRVKWLDTGFKWVMDLLGPYTP
jgi:hypothetical protein